MSYTPVIGLEVHVELKTKSKMFCGCAADYFGKEPNTHTCPVCLGLPGALPVPNKKAIEWCVMIGMALNCEIPLFSKFDRKNYFYPDLAKGYQISQYDQPFAINGSLNLKAKNEKRKTIRIRRVHMEEDTAKLMHQFGTQSSNVKTQNEDRYSLIDFNRSGVPLVEIVTEPDFENAVEVKEYLQKLQQIIRYLDVSDADMEKGEMRLEPNISLLPYTSGVTEGLPRGGRVDSSGVELPKYKVEVKNINSFKFVEKAINFEIDRQTKILEEGKTPTQETRGWDEKKQLTYSQRIKEEAHDYRYFPEPDIPPLRWKKSQLSELISQMPELPDTKFRRFVKKYGLTEYDTEILTRERSVADYFETTVKDAKKIDEKITSKQIANFIINKKIDVEQILPAQLVQQILANKQTATIDEDELEKIINEVIKGNQNAVSDYKKGKESVIMFLVGQVMKKSKEKLDPAGIKHKLQEKLKSEYGR